MNYPAWKNQAWNSILKFKMEFQAWFFQAGLTQYLKKWLLLCVNPRGPEGTQKEQQKERSFAVPFPEKGTPLNGA